MQVGFDMKGQYNAQFPSPGKVTPIITLGRAFLKKEDELDEADRTVYTESIRDLLATVDASLDLKSSGESQRTLSSEQVKALDKQAVTLIKKIHRTMVYEFGDTPAEATKWGFEIRQTGKRSGTILLPDGRPALVKTLSQYLKTEKARPAAERFKAPTLNEVQAVVEGLTDKVTTRRTAKGQRSSGVKQSTETGARLLDLLQAAAVQIVVQQFDCKVTPDLAQWGFTVVARKPGKQATVPAANPT